MRNLLIGLHEAGGDARQVKALFLQVAEKAKSRKPPTDATADAVEGVRGLTEEQLAGLDTPTPVKATDPLLQSVEGRVAELEATNADMVVRIAENGKPVTLADELARIRREVLDGTDDQLGVRDADLVRVAADCALTGV